jgi:hypothetical protein
MTPLGERGSVFVAVLLITLIATALLIGATYQSATRLRGAGSEASGSLARLVALAGLEAGAGLASTGGAWRDDLGTGGWLGAEPVGDGSVSVTATYPNDGVVEVDGEVGSASSDTVRLTANGTHRDVSRRFRGDFVPLVHPALTAAVFSATTIRTYEVTVEGRVRGNGSFLDQGAVRSAIFGDVTTTIGGLVSPWIDDADTDVRYVSTAIALPALSFNWFRDAGERMSIPLLNTLSNASISDTENPLGQVSPDAIYWMDALGGTIIFTNVAVHACVAILNANEVIVHDAVSALLGSPETPYYHHSPDPDRLPALVVQGKLRMCIEGRRSLTLRDSGGTRSVTSSLGGVFYSTGLFKGPQFDAPGALTLEGAVVAGSVELYGDTLLVRHDPRLNTTPLAELTTAGLRPVAGTTEEL